MGFRVLKYTYIYVIFRNTSKRFLKITNVVAQKVTRESGLSAIKTSDSSPRTCLFLREISGRINVFPRPFWPMV